MPRHLRAAFNHAFESHRGDPRLEEIAHRIAVGGEAAVRKVGDAWVRRDREEGQLPNPSNASPAGALVLRVPISSSLSRALATETAFSSAIRTTLAGSMMPASIRSVYSLRAASKPKLLFALKHACDNNAAVNRRILGNPLPVR
jgi:hypothetical protein